MSNQEQKTSEYKITLNKEQIGIVKNALSYYHLLEDYGTAFWMTIPGACWGREERRYLRRSSELLWYFHKICPVNPERYHYFIECLDLERLLDEALEKHKKKWSSYDPNCDIPFSVRTHYFLLNLKGRLMRLIHKSHESG